MLAFLALFLSLFHSHVTNYTKMVDHVSASVVRISARQSEGSVCTGFVIGEHRVLTANHCVGKLLQVDGHVATVLKVDQYYDLALLSADTKKLPLQFNDASVWRFEPLTAIGYGFGWTQLTVLKVHVILSAQEIANDSSVGIIVQGAYIHGMSGGPVVDESGLVVSIAQQESQGMGFGISTLMIRAFLLGT